MNKQELLNKMSIKERELNNLEYEYNKQIEGEKEAVLKSKSSNMNKTLYLLGFEFESSSERTKEYLEFHRIFKKEFKELLKPYIKEILIDKPNHFDINGFFKLNDNRVYNFFISDLRWFKDLMTIRIAKDFKDYNGGSNHNIVIDKDFSISLLNYLERQKHFDKVGE